ncbi:hypothetical protein CCAX7_56090 [Capsulimonas corticalis]|uniref:Uncharacterized protein n=1 Tax=Capsulimonas corticalis TaxID=2219043 RepID=A0A402D0S8_9BACT|nr:hypothetical protein [Capsulimonas corticalis]BDI33558.1 hypothetical protein CCAX7_56090 [Capsulimonas corticalis]
MTDFVSQDFPPPASAANFELALRQGLGRAVLWLRSSAIAPDRDLIFQACRENWAYDKQSEDNRALYMADVVRATGEPEFYVPRILETLVARDAGNSFAQLFQLAGILASEHNDAREKLYEIFAEAPRENPRYMAQVLVDIDGLEGYLFAVRGWIREPYADADCLDAVHLLDDLETQFGAETMAAFLADASSLDPAITAYHDAVRERRKRWKSDLLSRPKRTEPTYEELNAMLDHPKFKSRGIWASRGRRMDDAAADRFAADLLTEKNPDRLCRLLYLFGEYEFPSDPAPLFALSRSDNETVANAAAFALSALTDPGVRALGLSIMRGERAPWDGVRLLIYNFQHGDCAAILHLLSQLTAADEIHSLGFQIYDIFDENPVAEFSDALMRLYERGMCSMCRSGVISRLATLGALSETILTEGIYDASEETRRIIASAVTSPP